MLSFLYVAAGPIEQFEIKRWMHLDAGGMDLSFTNSSFYMILAVVLVLALFGYAASKGQMVPSRLQSLGEVGYGFVANMVRGAAGEEGLKFFPFVFTLFFFILAANLIGMVPYAFTTTSHIAVTAALALLVISIVIVYGLYKNGTKFFGLFAPPLGDLPGVAKAGLYVLLIPIEIVSFLARPLTLALRLFANMLAGHLTLKLFAGFVVSGLTVGGATGIVASIGAGALGIALNGLEFLVAGLQAYVFAILTCVYLNDAIHPSH